MFGNVVVIEHVLADAGFSRDKGRADDPMNWAATDGASRQHRFAQTLNFIKAIAAMVTRLRGFVGLVFVEWHVFMGGSELGP